MAEDCKKGHDYTVVSRTVTRGLGTTITTVVYECKRCGNINTVTSEKKDG